MNTLSTEEAAAYAADAHRAHLDDEDGLARVSRLAREATEAQGDVARLEAELAAAQKRLRGLEEFQLPEAMAAVGQKSITTADGVTVAVKEQLHASIPEANLGGAVAWLVANGQGAIVKRELKVAFGKGEDQKAAEAYDALTEHGFHPTDKQSVHPQTLGAVLRELVEQGVDVPMELLGAHVRRVAVVGGKVRASKHGRRRRHED